MKKNIISEEHVKFILGNILLEEMSKISRQDFNRVQFKIEELENSLYETLKEFRKLEDSIPNALKTTIKKKIASISSHLNQSESDILQLKNSIKLYKRKLYSQQIDEKK